MNITDQLKRCLQNLLAPRPTKEIGKKNLIDLTKKLNGTFICANYIDAETVKKAYGVKAAVAIADLSKENNPVYYDNQAIANMIKTALNEISRLELVNGELEAEIAHLTFKNTTASNRLFKQKQETVNANNLITQLKEELEKKKDV